MPDRTRARELAAEFNKKGDPTGWFEALYKEAEAGKSVVPWDDRLPNPNFLAFWKAHPLPAAGRSALVIGCGLGDDAGQLADWGFQVTAFDISETAIRTAQKRFAEATFPSGGSVEFFVADLFSPPASWQERFDFVLECYTLQALPASIRARAIEKIPGFLRAGGHLLLIARGRNESDPEGQMPWPLTREEISVFQSFGLEQLFFEDFPDPEEPDTRRFRVLYQRP